MAGLVYKNTNSQLVSISGTAYENPTAGTARLNFKTGSASTDVLKFGLTTNTSATQYCGLRMKISGGTAYIGRSESARSTVKTSSSTTQQTNTTSSSSTSSSTTYTSQSTRSYSTQSVKTYTTSSQKTYSTYSTSSYQTYSTRSYTTSSSQATNSTKSYSTYSTRSYTTSSTKTYSTTSAYGKNSTKSYGTYSTKTYQTTSNNSTATASWSIANQEWATIIPPSLSASKSSLYSTALNYAQVTTAASTIATGVMAASSTASNATYSYIARAAYTYTTARAATLTKSYTQTAIASYGATSTTEWNIGGYDIISADKNKVISYYTTGNYTKSGCFKTDETHYSVPASSGTLRTVTNSTGVQGPYDMFTVRYRTLNHSGYEAQTYGQTYNTTTASWYVTNLTSARNTVATLSSQSYIGTGRWVSVTVTGWKHTLYNGAYSYSSPPDGYKITKHKYATASTAASYTWLSTALQSATKTSGAWFVASTRTTENASVSRPKHYYYASYGTHYSTVWYTQNTTMQAGYTTQLSKQVNTTASKITRWDVWRKYYSTYGPVVYATYRDVTYTTQTLTSTTGYVINKNYTRSYYNWSFTTSKTTSRNTTLKSTVNYNTTSTSYWTVTSTHTKTSTVNYNTTSTSTWNTTSTSHWTHTSQWNTTSTSYWYTTSTSTWNTSSRSDYNTSSNHQYNTTSTSTWNTSSSMSTSTSGTRTTSQGSTNNNYTYTKSYLTHNFNI